MMDTVEELLYPNICKNIVRKIRRRSRCMHNNIITVCKECKILGIGGSNLCNHHIRRYKCKKCYPYIINHYIRLYNMGFISENPFCIHNSLSYICSDCKFNTHIICLHNKKSDLCIKCKQMGIGGHNLCHHNQPKTKCYKCDPLKIKNTRYKCIHNRQSYYCKECKLLNIGGHGICSHNINRTWCKECKLLYIGGTGICSHNKRRYMCQNCKL